jgi:hypothetical protein
MSSSMCKDIPERVVSEVNRNRAPLHSFDEGVHLTTLYVSFMIQVLRITQDPANPSVEICVLSI